MGINYKGVGYTGLQSTVPTLAEQAQLGGKLRINYDTFTLTADLAAGDKILMGAMIPEGAVLVDCVLTNGALGGSCTVDVGWEASSEIIMTGGESLQAKNTTGFFSALPVSSAGVAKAHGSTYEGGGGADVSSFWRVRITSPIQPAIYEHAVSSGATGKIIALEIWYLVD